MGNLRLRYEENFVVHKNVYQKNLLYPEACWWYVCGSSGYSLMEAGQAQKFL